MNASKPLPAGCSQQSRYPTRQNPRFSDRHEHWAELDYRETVPLEKHRYQIDTTHKRAEPYSLGDAAIAAGIVGFIVWVVSLGPWL